MSKKILILGSTGHLGKVLTKFLLTKNYDVVTLVRSPEKFDDSFSRLKIIKGNVTERNDLEKSLESIDVVISVLGHGFRTKYPIQENVMKILIPLMEKKKVKRLITVTGEALIVGDENASFRARLASSFLKLVDPYRMDDAISQQQLLEKSSLDWTVVRTPVHSNYGATKAMHIGMNHPQIWQSINRKAVCGFINECIERDLWITKSPIIY